MNVVEIGADTGGLRHVTASATLEVDPKANPDRANNHMTTATALTTAGCGLGARHAGTPDGVCDQIPAADICERNMRIALEWIWDTRLSVTPRTDPISASVIPSS